METILTSAVLAAVLFAPAPTAPPSPAAPARIIDMHAHAFASDARWKARVGNPVTGQEMVATYESAHRDATFAAMKRARIVKAMVSGDHDAVLRWKQAAPDQVIVGYAFDDPEKVDLGFLRKEKAAGRLDALGEVGSQYAGIAPNDPRMEPIDALAEELDLPLGLHLHPGPPGASSIGYPKMRPAMGDPLLLEDVLVRHPRLRLYVMHAGWPLLERMIALLYAYPQVYLDVSVINWTQPRKEFHRYLRGLVEAGYGRRIMFGSDQMVWPGSDRDGGGGDPVRRLPDRGAEERHLLPQRGAVPPPGADHARRAQGRDGDLAALGAQPCVTRAWRAALRRAHAAAIPSCRRSPRRRRSAFQETTSSSTL